MHRTLGIAAVSLTAAAGIVGLTTAPSATARSAPATAHPFKVFAPSFVEDAAAHTVSLPRYDGSSQG